MDYEKEYNEALERAMTQIKECGDNAGRKRMIYSIFPQLCECEDETKSAIDLIAEERERQISKGFSWRHDDEHDCHQLSDAAIVYAAPAPLRYQVMNWWPWDKEGLKEDDSFTTEGRIGELVKAGALIVAEIERLQRMVNNVSKPIENEDERIRQALLTKFVGEKNQGAKYTIHGCSLDSIITYLEKQKEENHDGKKWIYEDDYHKDMERCFNDGKDDVLENPEKYGLQKEKKPDTFNEPYNSDEYEAVEIGNATCLRRKEQKPAEKQDYSGLNDSERAIHRGFLVAGVENVPVGIIKETTKECIAHFPWPTKWSEEDADMLNCCISSIEEAKENRYAYKETDGDTSYDREIDWLKSLRPQPKQEWSEEDEVMLGKCIDAASGYYSPDDKSAMKAWLESLHEKFNLRPK